ncbi:MAG TPA: hypothetical protein VH763_07410 [Gemmatimonadales bacterium]
MSPIYLSAALAALATILWQDESAAQVTDRRTSTASNVSSAAAAPILPGVFRPFGTISEVNGLQAKARPASPGGEIQFTYPSDLQGNVAPKQPVSISMDGTRVRFTRFPLILDETKSTEVGQGSVSKGAFLVKTKNVRVSPGGMITGETTVKSEDELEGFTGVVWVELRDKDGNPVYHKRALCRGVNLSQSQHESWSISAPPDSAAKAHQVVIHHGRMGCSRDRWDEALDKLKKAGEVAGTFAEAYVASQGGSAGGQTGGSTTQPSR